VKSASTEV